VERKASDAVAKEYLCSFVVRLWIDRSIAMLSLLARKLPGTLHSIVRDLNHSLLMTSSFAFCRVLVVHCSEEQKCSTKDRRRATTKRLLGANIGRSDLLSGAWLILLLHAFATHNQQPQSKQAVQQKRTSS